MRRRCIVRPLVVFLLLGAVVNLAVAWGFLLFLSSNSKKFDLAIVTAVEQRNQICVSDWHAGSSAGGVLMTMYAPDPRSPGAWLCVQAIHAGWPMRTVQGEQVMSVVARGVPGKAATVSSWGAITFDGSSVGIYPNRMHFMPVRPIWPGFALNTFFYAAILSLLFAGIGFVQRRRRLLPGLCPACSYPIGTSAVCTECGKPVTPRSVEAVT